MRQITEVLRLAAQGLSYRQIGQSVGISASTVQGYLTRAQRAGLSWPLPDDLDGAGPRSAAVQARRKRNSDQDGPSRIGWRSTASGNAASTSRCSCCGWNTSVPTRTAGAIPSSARTTAAGLAARTWSCAWSTPLASACSSISAAIRCRSPTPRRARSGRRRCLSCALGRQRLPVRRSDRQPGSRRPGWAPTSTRWSSMAAHARVVVPGQSEVGRDQSVLVRPGAEPPATWSWRDAFRDGHFARQAVSAAR